jgi:hypothetical protein
MKQYFTCDGCNLIFVIDDLNILDGETIYCTDCLVEQMDEQVIDEEEEEGEIYRPPRPLN